MGDFKHPLGNFKVRFLKGAANLFSFVSIYILSLFYKIDKRKNEIIISSSFFAPWKEDVHFKHIYKKIKTDTLLDTKRLYTLWQASITLKDYLEKLEYIDDTLHPNYYKPYELFLQEVFSNLHKHDK